MFTPTLENYKAITVGQDEHEVETVRPDYPKYFLNTLIIASATVAVSLLLGTFAAYSLARFSFRFKEDIPFTFLSFRLRGTHGYPPALCRLSKNGPDRFILGLTAAYN